MTRRPGESRWFYWVGTAIVLVIIVTLSAFLWYLNSSGSRMESVDNEILTPEIRNISRFRIDIETLVSERKYHQATDVLLTTEVKTLVDQAVSSGDLRWMAVYEDTLVLPGLAESIVVQSRPTDYWVLPDTSDTIIDVRWQKAATDFAKRFNLELQQAKKD